MANYNPLANTDDGSCTSIASGCTDPTAYNYSASNSVEDGSCVYLGCLDPLADNGYYEYGSPAYLTLTNQGVSPTNVCDGALPYDPSNLSYLSIALPPCPSVLDLTINPQSVCAYSGCNDANACNYSPTATTNDGSCLFCSDTTANNYDGGICTTGCIYCPTTTNVTLMGVTGPTATNQYGSIEVQWEVPQGTDMSMISQFLIRTAPSASSPPFGVGWGNWITNFVNGTDFTTADGTGPFTATVSYNIYGNNDYNLTIDTICTNSSEITSATTAQLTNISIPPIPVYGCTDPTMFNYNAGSNTDDGSCVPFIYGCTVSCAHNTNPYANVNATSATDPTSPCIYTEGCMDPLAANFGYYMNGNLISSTPCSSSITHTCDYYGCTDPTATNHDATATLDDGSCTYPGGCNPAVCPSPPYQSSLITSVGPNGFSFYSDNFNTCLWDHPGAGVLKWRQIEDANGPISPLPVFSVETFNPTTVSSTNPVAVTHSLSIGKYEYEVDVLCVGGNVSSSTGTATFNCYAQSGCS